MSTCLRTISRHQIFCVILPQILMDCVTNLKGENQTDLDKMSKQVEQLNRDKEPLTETMYVCRIYFMWRVYE